MATKLKRLKNIETVVKPETGEVHELLSFVPEVVDDNFVKVFKTLSEKVLKDIKALDGAVLLLFYILDNLSMNSDIVYLKAEYVSKVISRSPMQVRRYINQLLKLQYIFKTNEKHFYKINPKYLFKGKMWKYLKNQNITKKLPPVIPVKLPQLTVEEPTAKKEEKNGKR